MNDMRQTGVFVAIAAVLALTAVLAVPSRKTPEVFDDQGTLFYEEFDPTTCTSIEVISFDEKNNDTRYFSVKWDAKAGWIIPSHENYPADAEKPIVAAATIVNGLIKGALQATRAEEHATLGVIDPKAETVINADRAGTRLVLRAGDKLLCDLIIGQEVEGKWGVRSVRMPDSNRVYACKIDAGDISTRFANWVETDVLQLASANIKQLRLDAYKVDEGTGVVVPGEVLTLEVDDKSTWTMPGLAETEELDTSKPSDMRSALNDLTLVGVRRKPAVLAQVVKHLQGGGTLDVQDQLGVSRAIGHAGYYIESKRASGMRIVSNEGELKVSCDDGVVYDLMFGEVVYGDPDDVSAPSTDEEPSKPEGDAADGAEHRYLWVTARFDASLLGPELVKPTKPETAAEPEAPAEPDKKEDADKSDDDGDEPKVDAEKEYQEALKEYEDAVKERDEKLAAGTKRAEKLGQRFADWYYVVSADVYAKLRVTRADLVKAKEEPKTDDDPDDSDEHDDHDETAPKDE
jgi:Domain of unknown function (DUF4340)